MALVNVQQGKDGSITVTEAEIHGTELNVEGRIALV